MYQWLKHDAYTSMDFKTLFTEAINFMKVLPSTLDLEIGRITDVQHVLSVLFNLIQVKCALIAHPIRGYIINGEKRYYSMRVVEVDRIATYGQLIKQDVHRQFWKNASVADNVIFTLFFTNVDVCFAFDEFWTLTFFKLSIINFMFLQLLIEISCMYRDNRTTICFYVDSM